MLAQRVLEIRESACTDELCIHQTRSAELAYDLAKGKVRVPCHRRLQNRRIDMQWADKERSDLNARMRHRRRRAGCVALTIWKCRGRHRLILRQRRCRAKSGESAAEYSALAAAVQRQLRRNRGQYGRRLGRRHDLLVGRRNSVAWDSAAM